MVKNKETNKKKGKTWKIPWETKEQMQVRGTKMHQIIRKKWRKVKIIKRTTMNR